MLNDRLHDGWTALDLTWAGTNYNLVWVMSNLYGFYPWKSWENHHADAFFPGKDVIDKARCEGWIRKCGLCGAEIIGGALACIRPGCPMKGERLMLTHIPAFAEDRDTKIARLKREIAERQVALKLLEPGPALIRVARWVPVLMIYRWPGTWKLKFLWF
jgi:hypothetical protein